VWSKLLKDIKNPELETLLNALLSQYEKDIITNRLIAISLIKQGKTYKEIGEELWLSSSTIRSLKRILENKSAKEYQTYRQLKKMAKEKIEKNRKKEYIPEPSPFFDAIDHFFNSIPRKTGFRGTRRF
jgi:DNA-binding CsgD family transcriptional regulator